MRTVPLAVAALLVTSCAEAPTTATPRSESLHAHAAATAASGPEVAQLRRLVAPYHTKAKAIDGGWNEQITGCLELPGVGGMGFHYANLGYLFDGQVRWDQPEVLVFAPAQNARDGLKLVAVEYVFPAAASDPAPSVLGQQMHFNPAVPGYVLHVWVGDHNPSGLFEDWNPTVSCS